MSPLTKLATQLADHQGEHKAAAEAAMAEFNDHSQQVRQMSDALASLSKIP